MFVWSNGLVEAEKSGPHVRLRPFAGVQLKLRLDIDNEGGADCEEQTSLSKQLALCDDKGKAETRRSRQCFDLRRTLSSPVCTWRRYRGRGRRSGGLLEC